MGMLDNIKNFFRGSKSEPEVRQDDPYKKSMLISQIMNSIDRIKRINSFDSSIWNLSNVSSYDLQRKSLAELESMQAKLSGRLLELDKQSQRKDPRREALEESRWTGQKPQNMTNHDFDRFQRDDGR